MKRILRLPPALVLTVAVLVVGGSWSPSAAGYESDVHFGLTRWLALRAGFSESQAEAIAVADQRVDGGSVEAVQLDLEYACAGHFPEVARLAQSGRYPALAPVPAPASSRVVEAGGPAARRELTELKAGAQGKEGLLLGRLGRALHPLQDSWSHQGTPAQPLQGNTMDCDGSLASAHPLLRGGPDSHAADLTFRFPADTLAMAHATYDELLKWGLVEGKARRAAPWEALTPAIGEFAKAATKTLKRRWFLAQGLTDTRFLQGVSLPDGPDPGDLDWKGRRLPPLPGLPSQQHDAPVDVRAFFDRFLSRWLGSERVEAVAADMAAGSVAGMRDGDATPRPSAELVARLKLWKLRDHGAAAELAHVPGPLSAMQLRAIERMTHDPAASLPATDVGAALLALQPSTPAPMPMLPYIVRPLPAMGGTPRMIAIARLVSAPYDTVGWIAERQGTRWVLVEMVSSVDL